MPAQVDEMEGAAPGGTRPTLGREARDLLRIAVPLVAVYIAEGAMLLTTKAIVGRLGYQELAAVGISGNLAFELLFVLMGILSIVGVLVAQADGAGAKREAGEATRQGLVIATAIGVPSTVLVYNFDEFLALTGQDPVVVELAAPYVQALSGFLLPAMWFTVLRGFVTALGKVRAVMLISFAAVGLNYVLTLGLVQGAFGMPALGVRGAGLATTIVIWTMFFALLGHCYFNSALRGFGLFRNRLRFDATLWTEIVRLGIPVSGLVLLESGMFAAVSILSGTFGVTALAATEVLLGWVTIAFVFALGFAEATMVRVARGAGYGIPELSRWAGFLGMGIGAGILVALTVVPLGFPEAIVRIFLGADDPGFDKVSALAFDLLVLAALFQVFDGLQAIASRALRGLRDTYAPLWIAAFGYWVLGIGGGCLLAYTLDHGIRGLWMGMAVGLIVTGTLLAWRFVRLATVRVHAARS